MGLFSTPKCPHCGGKLQYTGYSWPYPEYRCPACIDRNKQARKVKELEKRIKELESSKSN
jgi:tRNA(Ile2) C34 agmatinyltransferase TiaS